MTLPQYALDYGACSTKELQDFIKNRTGQVAETLDMYKNLPVRMKRREPSRRAYVTILDSLDQAATFRFLDLTPELRILIYREILVDDPPRKSTNILRTSKLVYKEASDVVHKECTMRIDGWVNIVPSSQQNEADEPPQTACKPHVYFGNREWIIGECSNTAWMQKLDQVLTSFPRPHLRNIRISLVYSYDGTLGPNSVALETQTKTLTIFFERIVANLTELRRVVASVVFQSSPDQPCEQLIFCEPLLPLIHLSSKCTLRLYNLMPDAQEMFWTAAAAVDTGEEGGQRS